MFAVPRLLTGPESLLLAASGAALGALLVARLGRWPSSHGRLTGVLAAAIVASTLAVAPVTAWGIIADIHASKRLSDRKAERVGPESYGFDTALVDGVAKIIPASERYTLVASDRLDSNRALVFRLWSLSALLPRVAVTDPAASDWIVSWGTSPHDLGVAVGDVHVLEPRGGTDPPLYVARLRR